MNPLTYLKAAGYVVAALAGAALVYFAFAVPRIDSLEKRAADASAAAAQEKTKFLKEASDEQSRLQSLVNTANAQAATEAAHRALADSARLNSERLLDATSRAFQDRLARLPQAASCPAVESAARTLGDVEQRMEGFGGRCTSEVERLGSEVRRLEASP